MKKGILFDVDGTLWDSAPQVTEAWNEILASHADAERSITVEDMYNYMGRPMDEISRMMLPHLEDGRRWEIMEQCMEYENQYLEKHPGVMYPGVIQVLKELSGDYPLYIVSNCQDGYIQVMIKDCGLETLIEDFESYGRTGRPKGENIRLVVERNQLDRAIYVGDTAMDGQAARMAGIPFVHAAYGFGTAEEADGVIQKLEQLAHIAGGLL